MRSIIRSAVFLGLGDLSGGDHYSSALEVSADGTVVGWSRTEFGTEAFRWTLGMDMVSLGDLSGGDHFSNALGVSADGSVVVGSSQSELGSEAYRWTQSTGMVSLGSGSANDVSTDGSVVVGATSGAFFQPFRWTEATGMVGLQTWGAANGVSADGTVVVGHQVISGGLEAFRWTQQTGIVPLGVLFEPFYNYSVAQAVSIDGSVVVGYSGIIDDSVGHDTNVTPFRWTAGTGMIPLDIPRFCPINSCTTYANDISADGSIIVGGGQH